jgi:alkylation response protein AidB-like acyl-CoA dehydrogenase
VNTGKLLVEVERLRPLIAEHAPDAEANRRLSAVVYDAMYSAGLFGMLAPKARGGHEIHPVAYSQIIEAVAQIDAATAWNLHMNQGFGCLAAWLPAAGVDELYRDGTPTIASAFNPPAAAVRTDGGWRVTGRVPFASGCQNARWLAMPAIEMEAGQPKTDPDTGQPTAMLVFFPRSAATIHDTWHTVGMRGTGSADIAVSDLFIPDRLSTSAGPLQHPAPGFEGPLYRLWPWTLFLGEATVSIGIAAAAIQQAVRLCQTKTAAYNTVALRDQQLVHYLMGKAQSRVAASRDTLHASAAAAYEEVSQTNALLSSEAKVRQTLAACFAAEACAEAVRFVDDVVGTSSVRLGAPFERHFRDVHVLMQHATKSNGVYGTAGRALLGLEPDRFWFIF